MGREVHISTTAHEINAFLDTSDQQHSVCFRCGEVGHLRYQCLTFKVRLCWNHEEGTCTERDCPFAHGVDELRTPWKVRCVRVVKQNGKLISIGCNSSEHTFRRCPLHRDLLFF